jgi:hypothetical protein
LLPNRRPAGTGDGRDLSSMSGILADTAYRLLPGVPAGAADG